MSSTSSIFGKLVGRSMFDERCHFIAPNRIRYAFTAGATSAIIKAKILAGHAFFQNAVYVRTNGNLYCLEDFKYLKDLQSLLPTSFRTVNRGVLINGKRMKLRDRRTGAVGFTLLDHKGQRHDELVHVSDEGKRAIDDFTVKPFRRRPPRSSNPQKTPPIVPLSPAD